VTIRAQHRGADRFKALQHLGRGVAERVPSPAADQGDLRTPSLEQFA
jgi:hypothetical protein